jgi:3-oxoacyl-[acyl-carrier protein] reductase
MNGLKRNFRKGRGFTLINPITEKPIMEGAMRLKDRAAIITGGTRGIGKGISLRFAEEGASLAINYASNEKAAQETLEEVKKLGAKAFVMKGDIGDEKQVDEMVKRTVSEYGKVDILVNNAGVVRDRFITKMAVEDFDYVIRVNLRGPFLLIRAVLPYMLEAKYGKIVNISSRAMWGGLGQANYTASKGGLVSMTRGLALELARKNININCVAPGLVYTDMIDGLSAENKERMLQAQPTGKIGTPREIANVVLFLCTDELSYILGETILVDGAKQIAAGALGRIIRN